ncbi:MAG: hypothetical protein NUW37_01060 [Planctomycetes bacterium]|nr:hypothetical protein [Planctomycetota bacterium]
MLPFVPGVGSASRGRKSRGRVRERRAAWDPDRGYEVNLEALEKGFRRSIALIHNPIGQSGVTFSMIYREPQTEATRVKLIAPAAVLRETLAEHPDGITRQLIVEALLADENVPLPLSIEDTAYLMTEFGVRFDSALRRFVPIEKVADEDDPGNSNEVVNAPPSDAASDFENQSSFVFPPEIPPLRADAAATILPSFPYSLSDFELDLLEAIEEFAREKEHERLSASLDIRGAVSFYMPRITGYPKIVAFAPASETPGGNIR